MRQNPLPHESTSTQATQNMIAQKVTHKTPQIKPSQPRLAMPSDTLPDNYSNDDKGNEVSALPLVGTRRKVSEAGFSRPAQMTKRPHLQNSVSRKDMAREDFADFPKNDLKRAFSYREKPMTSIFLEPKQQMQQNAIQFATIDLSDAY